MNINTIPVNTISRPTAFVSAATSVKGYRVERRYEGDRTAAQVVSALMKVHDHGGLLNAAPRPIWLDTMSVCPVKMAASRKATVSRTSISLMRTSVPARKGFVSSSIMWTMAMKYISSAKAAEKWGLSERSVRNCCAEGRISGAFLTGKTWNIPEAAEKPLRKNTHSDASKTLLDVLRAEKSLKLHGGIYHKIQIDLTYNSNHIEGSRLTHDQTRYIFETNTIGMSDGTVKVDDVVETANHFKCIDMVIDSANHALSEAFIKQLHAVLKSGTSASRLDWFAVGDYKKLPNEVGGRDTTAPENVSAEMKKLLAEYNAIESKTFDDLLDFHYRFECIHPFQDGNGRVGRLLLFKECLRNNIVPFIIEDDPKMFYYRGLKEWQTERGYLRDTCLSAQDRFKKYLDYFRVPYVE